MRDVNGAHGPAIVVPREKPTYPIIRKVVDGRGYIESPISNLRIQRKTVAPNSWKGHVWMNCGNCGGRSFRPIVKPVEGGSAQVVELVCDDSRGGGCLRVYKLDMAGCLAGGGTLNDGKLKEDSNG